MSTTIQPSKILQLEEYALALMNQENYQGAYESFKKLSKKTQTDKEKTSCFNNLGNLHHLTGHYSQAISSYSQAMKYSESLKGDKMLKACLYLNFAVVYKEQSILEKAIPLLTKIIQLFEPAQTIEVLACAYNTLANIYRAQKRFEQSLIYHNNALTIRYELGNKMEVAKSLNNMGLVYKDCGKSEEALSYFEDALKIKLEEGNLLSVASSLANIGGIYEDLKNWEKAESYYLQSAEIRMEQDDKNGLAVIFTSLGEVYRQTGRYDKALSFLDKGRLYAEELQLLAILRANLKSTKKVYCSLKDYPKAIVYFEAYDKINERLSNKNLQQSLAEMQVKFETEQKDQAIVYLEKQKAVQEAANATVEAALKDLHHRVKNYLEILSDILTLQADLLTEGKAQEVAKTNEDRVRAIGMIHNLLYQESHLATIDMQAYMEELVEELVFSYGFVDMELHLEVDKLYLNVDKAIPLALITNELVTNALKYAYKDHVSPQLTVCLLQSKENQLYLKVQDNGVGKPLVVKKKKSNSFGLTLVHTLAEQLKAEMKQYNDNGAVYELLIGSFVDQSKRLF
ncbi:MAG: tetratricopeptide repeat protein [Chitinophagales bacterium]